MGLNPLERLGRIPLPKLAFIALLLLALIFGAYFRLNSPQANLPNEDEFYTMIPAVKLNVNHPNYDPRLFNFHHPFFGFKLMGALIDRDRDYTNTVNIPPNLLYWSYMAAPELRGQEASMRLMTALFGLLLFIPIFLIGRELHGGLAGLLAAAITGLSVGFINLSRVAMQDAFLPVFMFCAMYLSMKYLKAKPDEKIFSIDKPLVFLAGALVFIYLSFIIRLGQPLTISLALLLAVAMRNEKRHSWAVLYAAIFMVPTVLLSFGIEPFRQFLALKGNDLIGLRFNTEFISAAVSQGSFTFLAMLAFAVFLFAVDFIPKPQKKVFSEKLSLRQIRDKFGLGSTGQARAYIEGNFEYSREHDSYTVFEKKGTGLAAGLSEFFWSLRIEKKFMLITFALMLLIMFFTETGGNTRIYMFFFIIPIIFIAGKITRFTGAAQYALLGLFLLLDIASLYAANPHFNEYTVLGTEPVYIGNFSAQYAEIFATLGELGSPRAVSNEPGFLLRYPNSEPLAPNYGGFRESENCTAEYFASQKGSVLVYRNLEYDINSNQYVCPGIKGAKLKLVEDIDDGNKSHVMFRIFEFG